MLITGAIVLGFLWSGYEVKADIETAECEAARHTLEGAENIEADLTEIRRDYIVIQSHLAAESVGDKVMLQKADTVAADKPTPDL